MAKPKQTRQEVAKQAIVGWLEQGIYKPGDKLPPITQMARQLEVKDMPVRVAIQQLVKQGLLEARNGVGVFVRNPQASKNKRVMVLVRTAQSLERGWDRQDSFLLAELYDGIVQNIAAHHMTPVICVESDFNDDVAAIAARFKQEQCDGVILLDVDRDMALRLAATIDPWRIVSADFSSALTSLNEVKMRAGTGIHEILGKAYDMGHRHFACLYADVLYNQWSHVERFQAFVQFCNEHDLPCDPMTLQETDGTSIMAYRTTMKLLKARPELTAIFACNDARAVGAVHAIEDMGLKVGQDVSVIGFDDMPEAASMNLATVRVPRRQIGQQAVELLETCIGRKAIAQRALLQTTAVVRSSLGPPRPSASQDRPHASHASTAADRSES